MPSRKKPYSIEPLGKAHDRSAFSCGNEVLDRYLREQAGQDARRHAAAPFVLVEKNKTVVLGYYTLSSFGIFLEDLPEATAKKFPRYPLVPATLLGRLAVDENYKGKGLGELLLVDALKRSYEQAHVIGSAAVVVEALDEAAVAFYRHFDFLPFPNHPHRLFLPMKTVGRLF